MLRRAAAASPHPRSLVRVEVEEGLPLCLTDPSRLGQVLARLLDNAVKFSSATSLIQVSAHRAGDRVEIAVEDEGKGIPEEMLARVFEPFYQLEPAATRSVGGMGTGLYLARELCEVIGATIDVESALGKGSRFLVRVPVAN
ncbi:MAG: ATP-binding protein [Actinobacteria bacterium]|nr:MAG: ATP-binding protein [Actinomycetota bacterium]